MLITHDSFNKVACAAHQDVGEASKAVKGGKKLVRGLGCIVSSERGNATSLTNYKQARSCNMFADVRSEGSYAPEAHRCIHHCWRRVDEMRRSSRPHQ
jgi:hypothetical protein